MADNGRNERILHVLGLRIHRPMGWMVRPGNWEVLDDLPGLRTRREGPNGPARPQ